MIIEVCAGLVIAAAILGLLWVGTRASIECRKVIENGKTVLSLKANKNLKKVSVADSADGEHISFLRSNVRKGEKITFVYPLSQDKATLVIEDEKGTKTILVPLS